MGVGFKRRGHLEGITGLRKDTNELHNGNSRHQRFWTHTMTKGLTIPVCCFSCDHSFLNLCCSTRHLQGCAINH